MVPGAAQPVSSKTQQKNTDIIFFFILFTFGNAILLRYFYLGSISNNKLSRQENIGRKIGDGMSMPAFF